jgi:hypothetical protein
VTNQEYDKVRKKLLDTAEGIQVSKRPGYTQGDSDVLKNFKAVGDRIRQRDGSALGSGPAWSVYFLKHIDAILSIINRPDLPVSEAPIGRFADAINYLQLGYALYVEQVEAQVEAQKNQQAVPSKPGIDENVKKMLEQMEIYRKVLAEKPYDPKEPRPFYDPSTGSYPLLIGGSAAGAASASLGPLVGKIPSKDPDNDYNW